MRGQWIERRQRKKFRADGERRESALERESASLPLSRNALYAHCSVNRILSGAAQERC